VLHTKTEYDQAVTVLDNILDEIGQQETHPLPDLAETLSLSIEAYDDTPIPMPNASRPAILCTLMEEHGLAQSDLPEVGSQGVVSEILAGKRDLNVRQIAHLAERFGVSPVVFIPISTKTHKPLPTKSRKTHRR
jgi:HTH-type transcriptional regulator / antitoxin HigA